MALKSETVKLNNFILLKFINGFIGTLKWVSIFEEVGYLDSQGWNWISAVIVVLVENSFYQTPYGGKIYLWVS